MTCANNANISHIMTYWMVKIFVNDFNISDIVSEIIQVKKEEQ